MRHAREFVTEPLTDQQIEAMWPGVFAWSQVYEFARKIEAHHGIRASTQARNEDLVADLVGTLRERGEM